MDAMQAAKVAKITLAVEYCDGRKETKTVTLDSVNGWRPSKDGKAEYADIDGGFTGKGSALSWCLQAPNGYQAGFKMSFGVKEQKDASGTKAGGFTIA